MSFSQPHVYKNIGTYLGILGAIALAISLYIAGNTPGNGGYETSIYSAYSTTFWILVTLAICLGMANAFWDLLVAQNHRSWLYGLFIIVIANTLILLLPYLRDYAFTGSWDDVSHYSFAANITDYGSPHESNFYPVTHVLTSSFAMLTGIDLQVAMRLFPVLFYLVYLTNTAYLAYSLETSPLVKRLMLVTATPLIFGTYSTIYRPTQFAVCMLPLFIGFVYRTRLRKSSILSDTIPFILLLFFFPFVHPWAVLSAALLITCFVVAVFWNERTSTFINPIQFLNPLLILLTAWLAWFITFRAFGITLELLISSFSDGLSAEISVSHYADLAAKIGLPIKQILSLVLFKFGHSILYLGAITIASLVVCVDILVNKRRAESQIVAMILLAIIFTGLAIVSLFRNLITHNPLRLVNFALITAPLIVGYTLARTMNMEGVIPKTQRMLLVNIMVVLITSSSLLGVYASYFSPLVGEPSKQVSYAQQAGHHFLVENAAAESSNIYSSHKGARLMASVKNARDLVALRQENQRWRLKLLPAHFGNGEDELGIKFEDPGYFWVTGYEESYYTEVWPEGGRFNASDYAAIASNNDWHQVYTSGDLKIWRFNK